MGVKRNKHKKLAPPKPPMSGETFIGGWANEDATMVYFGDTFRVAFDASNVHHQFNEAEFEDKYQRIMERRNQPRSFAGFPWVYDETRESELFQTIDHKTGDLVTLVRLPFKRIKCEGASG